MKVIGIGCILLSCLMWGGLIFVPFISVTTGMKVTITGVLLVLGEVFFWIGTLLLGKEFLTNFWKKIKKIEKNTP